MLRRIAFVVFILASLALLYVSWRGHVKITLVEAAAFVTGAACVWLTVEENIWNWPLGIANSAFFVVLFMRSRLYADMGLNVLYIILGLLGWYWWLHGGEARSKLRIERIQPFSILALTIVGTFLTLVMTVYLRSVNDAAPFLDALTTVLSLIAQYMLTRKHLENWFVWMTADVIYVGLYAYRQLYLTAVLYAIFFAMCVAGYRQWRRTFDKDREPALG